LLQYLVDAVSRLGNWGYLIIFVIAVLECAAFLGLFVPGESLLLVAGFLCHRGILHVDLVILVAAAGATIGDNIGYQMGRGLGREWLEGRHRLARFANARLCEAEAFFERHGGKAVFLGRFVGYARALVPFVAGTAAMPRRTFFIYNAAGAVLWSVLVTLLGYFLGASWKLAEKWMGATSVALTAAVFAAAGIVWVLGRRHHRGT
jgi:undecaprenyl-diphosphatase